MRAARALALGLMMVAAGLAASADSGGTRYVVLDLADRAELEALTRLVSIDRVEGTRVWAYVSPRQVAPLSAAGYTWRELPMPGGNPGARMGLLERAAIGAWDAFPTYAEYVAMMEAFAADHPDLCRLEVIGETTNLVRPHQLLALRISDNPDLEEDEPEVFLTSSMHGDETTGIILLLRLADELLGHYDPGSSVPYDQRLTALVDSLEIWLNPAANPDGTYFGGDDSVADAVRSYTDSSGRDSGVNPNRNFPDPDDGDHPDGLPWWRETEAMMAFAEAHSFVLSANFHGGAEVVNYPWDTWSRLHADDLWFVALARAYADRAHQAATTPPHDDPWYLTDLDNGITNGYAWYTITGGRQDYMNFWHGSREVTIEVSRFKNPPGALLPMYWDYNREPLLGYLESVLGGVRGVVTDASGAPLAARVEVAWHDVEQDASWVETDPDVGDFHRLLLPGAYVLLISAPGYLPAAAPVTVGSGPTTRHDAVLVADGGGARTTELHGVVAHAGSGQPIAGAVVDLIWPLEEQAVTGADGLYELAVPEGACLLEVTAEGYQDRRLGHNAIYPDSPFDIPMLRRITAQASGVRPMVRP